MVLTQEDPEALVQRNARCRPRRRCAWRGRSTLGSVDETTGVPRRRRSNRPSSAWTSLHRTREAWGTGNHRHLELHSFALDGTWTRGVVCENAWPKGAAPPTGVPPPRGRAKKTSTDSAGAAPSAPWTFPVWTWRPCASTVGSIAWKTSATAPRNSSYPASSNTSVPRCVRPSTTLVAHACACERGRDGTTSTCVLVRFGLVSSCSFRWFRRLG